MPHRYTKERTGYLHPHACYGYYGQFFVLQDFTTKYFVILLKFLAVTVFLRVGVICTMRTTSSSSTIILCRLGPQRINVYEGTKYITKRRPQAAAGTYVPVTDEQHEQHVTKTNIGVTSILCH